MTRDKSRRRGAQYRRSFRREDLRSVTQIVNRIAPIFVETSPFVKTPTTSIEISRPTPTEEVIPVISPGPISGETGMIGNAIFVSEEDISPSTAPKETAVKNNPSVKNRLLRCYYFWERTIHAPFYVLSIIKNGYAIPFTANPPPCYAKNNRSSLRHQDFVESEISNCLEKSYIIEIDHMPYCCNPLTVAEGKKLRLVLDLRNVNPYVQKKKYH